MADQVLEIIHILGAAVLFGTGLGIAFFFWWANRSASTATIAGVARIVVVADFLFTLPAVIVQPITGAWLAFERGYALTEGWLAAAIVLYLIAGACWIPVVWLQLRLRDLAAGAAETGDSLPALYQCYYRIWFALGWPAFGAVVAIIVLMVTKPVF